MRSNKYLTNISS